MMFITIFKVNFHFMRIIFKFMFIFANMKMFKAIFKGVFGLIFFVKLKLILKANHSYHLY
jgi:hypothetical protein